MSQNGEPDASRRPSPEPTSEVGKKCEEVIEKYRGGSISAARALREISEILPESLDEDQREAALDSYIRMLSKHGKVRSAAAKRGRRHDGSKTPPAVEDDDDDDDESDEESERDKKRVKQSTEDFLASAPWVVRRQLEGRKLNESLKKTSLIVYHATRSFAQVKASLLGPGRPPFPDTEWNSLILGRSADFDRIFTSQFTAPSDEERTPLTKTVDIVHKSGPAATGRKVTNAAQWHAAWTIYQAAAKYVFPHRSHELDEYGRYINYIFVARPATAEAQQAIIEYDRQLRSLVATRGDLELTDFHDIECKRIEMQYLHSGGVGNGGGHASSAPKPANSPPKSRPKARTIEVCRRFNDEIPHTDCTRFHGCQGCGAPGIPITKCSKCAHPKRA